MPKTRPAGLTIGICWKCTLGYLIEDLAFSRLARCTSLKHFIKFRWTHEDKYFWIRLNIVRLADLNIGISIEFSHPWVSGSVSNFYILWSQVQYRIFTSFGLSLNINFSNLNVSLSWNCIALWSRSLSLSIMRLSDISLSISIKNCEFQVSVSLLKILVFKSQYQYRNKSFESLSLSIEHQKLVWHCVLSLNKDSSFLILPLTLAPPVRFGWNLKWPTFYKHHCWWLDFQGQKGHIKARWVTFWPLFEIFSIHLDSPF